MNGYAMAVDTKASEGPRVKRLRTARIKKAGDNFVIQFPGTALLESAVASPLVKEQPNEIGTHKAALQSNGISSEEHSKTSQGSKKTPPAPDQDLMPKPPNKQPLRLPRAENRNGSHSQSTRVDLSSVPNHPVDLTWWIAQQLTHFQEHLIPESDPSFPLKFATGISKDSHFFIYSKMTRRKQPVDKEKLREDNRIRKAEWRATNPERNSYNEMYGRICRTAKDKFGPEETPEKRLWIQDEIIKRSRKREDKQRRKAKAAGTYPSFAGISKAIGPVTTSRKEDIATQLLRELLQANGESGSFAMRKKAAQSITTAIQNQSLDNETLGSALKKLASNKSLMEIVNRGLDIEDGDEDIDSGAQSEDKDIPLNLHSPVPPSSEPTLNEGELTAMAQSNEKIKALNSAYALMVDMADNSKYASPYANPPQLQKYSQVRSQIQPEPLGATSHPQSGDVGLEIEDSHMSEVDALLMLANGGSLTRIAEDDEDEEQDDDKTVAESQASSKTCRETNDDPKTDHDVAATIDHIVNLLLEQRIKATTSNSDLGLPAEDTYSGQLAKEQAQRLKGLFREAGTPVNCVLPATHSQTVSQTYNQLVNILNPQPSLLRARPPVPSDFNSSISLFPSRPASENQPTLFAHPAPAANQDQQPVDQGAPMSTQRGTTRQNTGSRTEDEQRKIKSYGFPPLPGIRVGVDRSSKKGKKKCFPMAEGSRRNH